MKIIPLNQKVVEKILRDKEGRLVRARFTIYENGGRIKARLLDFTYIETLKNVVLKITGFIREKTKQVIQTFEKGFISPFFNSKILHSSGSKPRAPTFI